MAIPFNWIASDRYSTTFYAQLWTVTRAGNNLYALMSKTDFSGVVELHKSSDFGATWALLDNTCPITSGNLTGALDFYYALDGKLRVMYVAPPDGGGTIKFTQFDLGSLTWSSVTNIGGGFTQTQNAPIGGQEAAGFFEYIRGDGSRIVAYQTDPSGSGWKRVRILKEVSGTWTSLALIGGSDPHYILFNGLADTVDNVHLLINSYDSNGTADLYHVSVAAADDSVSSLHLIDSDIEDNATNMQGFAASTASGRGDISGDGQTIAWAYGYTTNYGWTAGTGALRVAIADLSGNPLNPSWTIETVATNTAKFFNTGESIEAAATFQGSSNLQAIWGTFYSSGPSRANIYSSDRTAPSTWTAPTAIFAAQSDGSGTIVDIQGFDLLNGYTNGVGIIIDQQSNEGSSYTWIGFNGPPGISATYVSSGGALAGPGNYASA